MVKLFVSGFPGGTDELKLARLFCSCGDLKTIKLVRDKKTQVCKGYGFIEMGDMASARSAIAALHGMELGDGCLTVKISEEEEPPKVKTQRPCYQAQAVPAEVVKRKRPRLK